MTDRFEDRCRYVSVISEDSRKDYFLSIDEFEMLYDSGLLWEWDEKYSLMLDDLDGGVIDRDLEYNLLLVSDRIGDGAVKNAFELAVNTGGYVYFFL